MLSQTGTPANPWVWSANDPQGLAVSISIPWNTSNRSLGSATVTRATGCTLGRLYIGLGTVATPDSARNAYAVTVGRGTVSAHTLAKNGLSTIDNVMALQITAGP